MSHFSVAQPVLFKHCDPAGIVFYPRYFEMINDAIELFFTDGLHSPWPKMLQTHGVPTASISVEFAAPSRHGDLLDLQISVTRIGTSSLGLMVRALCADELRFTSHSTLVQTTMQGRPAPWSDRLRPLFSNFMNEIPNDA
jgi:4-hydroxybenzoyl-CoA thioesterase